VQYIHDGEIQNELRLKIQPITIGPNAGDSLFKKMIGVKTTGKPDVYKDKWIVDVTDPLPLPIHTTATNDFALVVGSFKLVSYGEFKISLDASGNLIVDGSVRHVISQKINGVIVDYDIYDFNAGKEFPPAGTQTLLGLLGYPTIKFDELNLLKQCDTAKDYHQNAEWKRTFFVDINKDTPTSFYRNILLTNLFKGP
jgi:hypothetical protein